MKFIVATLTAFVISIATPALFVNAEGLSLTKKQTSKKLLYFIDQLEKKGGDDYIRDKIAPFLDLEPHAPTKSYALEDPVLPKDRPDHIIELVVSTTTLPGKLTRRCLVLTQGSLNGNGFLMRYFKFNLQGELIKTFTSTGLINDSGNVVKGSGVKTDLNVLDPAVVKRAQEELNFWLSGAYKRYPKPKAAKK